MPSWWPRKAQAPYDTLLLEGGCVKGVAYAGAAHALEEAGALGSIRRFAGSSAGAMAAALLAAGVSASELSEILLEIDFRELLDAATVAIPTRLHSIVQGQLEGASLKDTVSALTSELFNGFREGEAAVEYRPFAYNPVDLGRRLVTEYGMFRGVKMQELIESLLIGATGEAGLTFGRLRELRPGVSLRLTATSITHQRVHYFDADATPDVPIALAVRASSAVPLLYAPVEIDGELFVDGGLLKNLPYDAFDLDGHPTLALSIRTPTQASLKQRSGSPSSLDGGGDAPEDAPETAPGIGIAPTLGAFFAALLETLTFGEGSANCLSHALVRDGLDLVELGVYEHAPGFGFDVTREDKLKMVQGGYDAVRAHLLRRTRGDDRGDADGADDGAPMRWVAPPRERTDGPAVLPAAPPAGLT